MFEPARLPGAVAALGRRRARPARSRCRAPRDRPRTSSRGTPPWRPRARIRRRRRPPAPRPAPYRALELIAAARTATRDEGFAAEDEALADLLDERRAARRRCTPSTWCRSGPSGRPARPTESLARPVTKVGIVGAGLMASQLALLFVRRLEVPVVLTDLDQDRVDKGVGYVHAEIDKLLGKGRISPDQANRLKALVTGAVDKDGVRRRRLRDRGGLRGDGGQEAGLRRGRGGRVGPSACWRPTPRRCRSPRWPPTWSTPSGSSASTSSTRSR